VFLRVDLVSFNGGFHFLRVDLCHLMVDFVFLRVDLCHLMVDLMFLSVDLCHLFKGGSNVYSGDLYFMFAGFSLSFEVPS